LSPLRPTSSTERGLPRPSAHTKIPLSTRRLYAEVRTDPPLTLTATEVAPHRKASEVCIPTMEIGYFRNTLVQHRHSTGRATRRPGWQRGHRHASEQTWGKCMSQVGMVLAHRTSFRCPADVPDPGRPWLSGSRRITNTLWATATGRQQSYAMNATAWVASPRNWVRGSTWIFKPEHILTGRSQRKPVLYSISD
jgi:hypothetical protein